MSLPNLITIVGPTAVGKTDLTIDLGRQFHSAIISGDAYQIYRGLDIGSAKPTVEEQGGLKHYLIDCKDPHDSYSAADFQKEARAIILQENEKGTVPILSGGTGLYVQALLEHYEFTDTEPDAELRAKLDTLFEKEGLEGLRQYANSLATQKGIVLPLQDKHRLYRAIELLQSGQGEVLEGQNKKGLSYNGPVIGLQRDRETLYERINLRVDIMMDRGLEEEVRRFYEMGFTGEEQSMKGIGYKEWFPYFRQEISKDEVVETIKKNTRHFAKRQITWYKRMPYIDWITIEKGMTKEDILEEAMTIVKNNHGLL